MSVRKRGKQFEVRWTEGGRKLSRSFLRAEDARAFDIDIKRRKQLGALAPGVIQSRKTLAEFVEEEWWPRYAIPSLAPDTRRRYLEVWSAHLLPRLGDYELREITPIAVEDFREQMSRAKVGAPTQRKALILLQGILRRAVVRGLIPVNPAQLVDKPKPRPARSPAARAGDGGANPREMLLPRTRIVPAAGPGKRPRRAYRPQSIPARRQRNALIVSMLAYGGCAREDRASKWGDLRDRTLHVVATKPGRPRDVDLLAPLAQDLAEWRMVCGRPPDDELIVARLRRPVDARGLGNWRRRIWRPAAIEAGVTGDLGPTASAARSFRCCSGRGQPDLRRRAGRALGRDPRRDYAGTMRELETQPASRRRGHPAGPRGTLRDVLRTHPKSSMDRK